ncbi:hypothetical protein CSPX01_10020 [Colletotrichum filicis]|nr:hypothetical protein CSPX01_10020 [Colletotrichum filicis]
MAEWDETTRKGPEEKKQRVNPLERDSEDVVLCGNYELTQHSFLVKKHTYIDFDDEKETAHMKQNGGLYG